jgi:hypothetical protein
MVGLMTMITSLLAALEMSGWLAQLAAVQRHNLENSPPYSVHNTVEHIAVLLHISTQ